MLLLGVADKNAMEPSSEDFYLEWGWMYLNYSCDYLSLKPKIRGLGNRS